MITLNNRWAVLALLYITGIAVPIQFQSVAVLAPLLNAEGVASHAQLGVLAGLFMLPGALLALPGGMIGALLGDRVNLVLGFFFLAAGSALFLSGGGFTSLAIARFLGGLGGTLVFVQRFKIATDWFAGREISTAMAITASAFGLGVGIALPFLGAIAEWGGWRAAMHVNTGFALVALVLVLLVFRLPHRAQEPTTTSIPLWRRVWGLSRAEFLLILVSGSMNGLFVSGYLIFMAYAPLYLVEQGHGLLGATSLVSVAGLLSLLSIPLGGYLTDRFRNPNLFITLGALGTGLACVLFTLLPWPLVWAVLFGLIRGGCTGGILSLPSEVLRPANRGVGMGLNSMMNYGLMFGLITLAGVIREAVGSATQALWFGAAMWAAIFPALILFRVGKRYLMPEGAGIPPA